MELRTQRLVLSAASRLPRVSRKWTNKKAHHNRSQRRIEPKPPSNEGMAVTIYNVTLRDREIKPSSVTITVHGRRRGTRMNGFELVLNDCGVGAHLIGLGVKRCSVLSGTIRVQFTPSRWGLAAMINCPWLTRNANRSEFRHYYISLA